MMEPGCVGKVSELGDSSKGDSSKGMWDEPGGVGKVDELSELGDLGEVGWAKDHERWVTGEG